MIEQARRRQDIRTRIDELPTWRVASAENHSFLPDASVDMVVCATAAHWLKAPDWWDEMARLVRPSGTVACFAYGQEQFRARERLDGADRPASYQIHGEVIARQAFETREGILRDLGVESEGVKILRSLYDLLPLPSPSDERWLEPYRVKFDVGEPTDPDQGFMLEHEWALKHLVRPCAPSMTDGSDRPLQHKLADEPLAATVFRSSGLAGRPDGPLPTCPLRGDGAGAGHHRALQSADRLGRSSAVGMM